jgi:hypothetical protein
MGERRKEAIVRISKEDVFNTLIGQLAPDPPLWRRKQWRDVKTFGDDPNDTTFCLVIFNEENDT